MEKLRRLGVFVAIFRCFVVFYSIRFEPWIGVIYRLANA